jgi:hypothetical protein
MHEDEEHMDIEPTRIEGVSPSSPAPLDRDEFWDHEPSKDEIWEVGWILGFIVFVRLRDSFVSSKNSVSKKFIHFLREYRARFSKNRDCQDDGSC